MVAKSLKWALAGLAACPSAALALGLGDIHLLSKLDAPLDAEIALVGATTDDLASLKPQIASRELFTQHGLDWSPFLSNVTVRAVRAPDGHEILKLSSTQPVTEPFLTVLIELDWDRGRFVREYDLLLDPPTYTPNQGQVARAIQAPVSDSEAHEGAIERSAPAPSVPAPPVPASAAAASAATPGASAPVSSSPASKAAAAASAYQVHRGDTLSRIASRFAGGSAADERRWMVATYQVNPAAFDHNMNWLRAGSVLRIPSQSVVRSISLSGASAEVHRQYVAWRSESAHSARAADQPGRLRLVAPSAPASASATARAAGAASQELKALQGEVHTLQSQLDESRRLLAMRNAELSQLQAKIAARESGAAPASTATGASAAPASPPAAAPQSAPVTRTASAAASSAPSAAANRTAARQPARRPIAASHPRPAAPASSWFDALKSLWWVIGLGVALVLGLLGLRAWTSRRKAGFDDSLGRLAEASAASHAAREPAVAESQLAPRRENNFLVEETGTHERPRLEGAAAATAAARHVETDDTISSETAINLDQGDPLAEADFHMAYGLYDQAADLVRIAIQRDPERRDLKLKLLEVFFVWGNKEQFLQTARDLAETREQAIPGEWEKVVIMGQQLAAEDPLFAGADAVSGAAAGGVDLDLEGGQHRVDFDVAGEPVAGGRDTVDLDIGSAIGERDPVAEAAAHQATDQNLALDDSLVLPDDATAEQEFVTATHRMTAVESGIGTTREMTAAREMTATREMIATREMTTTLEHDSFNPEALAPEGPTVEQPALHSPDHPTIRQKVEMALKAGTASEHTTELALDDLGLDLSALQEGPQGTLETAAYPAAGDAAPDAPTLVAGLDEHSRRIMESAEKRAESGDDELKISETGTWHFDDDALPGADGRTFGQAGPGFASGDLADTSRLTALKVGEGVDFEIGEPQPAAESHAARPHVGASHAAARVANGSPGRLDLDVGVATVPDVVFAATQRLESDDLALPDLDPVTMSEVGTKLDLARAYMDMGDPEGARSILEEVLAEGSAAQKQEAERLIGSLPG